MQANRLKKKIYEKIVNGNLDSALSKIRQIEKKETLDWNLMYWAGLCLYLNKDLDLARYYLEKSIKAGESKNQFVATVYSALGIVQQEKGELNEAIKSLKMSILPQIRTLRALDERSLKFPIGVPTIYKKLLSGSVLL